MENQTILSLQRKLLLSTDPNVVCEISHDNKQITASNISAETFMELRFITNDPIYKNAYMTISHVDVFLNENLFPTPIYGLDEIVKTRFEFSDLHVFLQKNDGQNSGVSHRPFKTGFGKPNSPNGLVEITDVIKSLAMLTDEVPAINCSTTMKFKIVVDMKE